MYSAQYLIKLIFVVFLCTLGAFWKLHAFSTTSFDKMEVVSRVQYVEEDTMYSDSFENLRLNPDQINWRPLTASTKPDFEVRAYWLKFDLSNPTSAAQKLVLSFDRWDLIEVYVDTGTGSRKEIKTGEAIAFARRDIPYGNGRKVRLDLPSGATYSIVCRLYQTPNQGLPPYSLQVECGTEQASQAEDFLMESINLVAIALLALIFIYNFFFFVTTKERRYRFYLLHMALVSLEFARRGGYFNTLWGDLSAGPQIDHQLFLLLNFLSIVAVLLLFSDYLDTRKYLPFWHKYILGLIVPTVFLYVIAVLNFPITLYITCFALSGTMVFFFYLNWLIIRKGHPVANYFLPGLVFFSIGNIVQAFSQAGIWEIGEVGEVLVRSLGMIVSDVILSYGLGRRVFLLKEENERKSRLVIETLEEQQAMQLLMGREVLNSQENLRKGIAARLHDDIQNILVSIRFNLMAFRPGKGKGNQVKTREVDLAVAQLKSAIQMVRQISHDLMPTSLSDPYGLDVSLENYLLAETGTGELNYHYPDPRPLPDSIRTLAYRIVQEIVNPEGRTSNSDRMDLTISNDEQNLSIRFRDYRVHAEKSYERPEVKLNLPYFLSLFGGSIDSRIASDGAVESLIKIPLHQITIEKEAQS
jgi:signal transduction histidine kinase